MLEWKMLVSGKVQGVGFRYSVVDFVKRNHCQVKGYVRNLPDGNVEVMAHGEKEELDRLLGFVSEGPTLSRVDDVKVFKTTVKESYFKDFSISH